MLGVMKKSWMAVLLAMSLVVGLLGAGVNEAQGQDADPMPDNEAVYSACVGNAAESRGFTDVAADSTHEDAINCIAHYEITVGSGDGTTYSPTDAITRWQMALFLARAAGTSGIVLNSSPASQGFTDIGGLSDEAQMAINQLAEIGIMPGTSATVFSPSSPVTRRSMAVLLDAFLSRARLGVGALGGGTADEYTDIVVESQTVFTDIALLSVNEFNAVLRMYEVGVTTGATGGVTYDPNGLVNRAQMASFITRTLAHTIARPAGMSIQTSTNMQLGTNDVEVWVSLRNDEFQPLVDQYVDVFTSTAAEKAFDEDGACVSDQVSLEEGLEACEIDFVDLQSSVNGDINYTVNIPDADDLPAMLTVWAWTGEQDDTFDSDEEGLQSVSTVIEFGKDAAQWKVEA